MSDNRPENNNEKSTEAVYDKQQLISRQGKRNSEEFTGGG